ncbi:hypothetical protein YTPLAS18_32270 [Nitrospira sp.]|nr:hypothetical protein YTPLAS18_32270 [Nitrospira sp.]
MARLLGGAAVILSLLTVQAVSADTRPTPPPHPLSALLGTWDGNSEDGRFLRITYQFTANGTALVEIISPENEPNMTSLYYVDGHHLMLTHYCSLGNQPRMVADLPRGTVTRVVFAFLDATNLASPTDPHMHKLILTTQDMDHMTQIWTLSEDGRETTHIFTLVRQPS